MPLISNLAVLAQMPMDYILIITSTAKEERIPQDIQSFIWAEVDKELYKGDEDAERSKKRGCKGTLSEKDGNLIHTEKEYPAALEKSNRMMKASRRIQSDEYDQMNRRMTAFRIFQDRSNKEYMRSLKRANEKSELGWS